MVQTRQNKQQQQQQLQGPEFQHCRNNQQLSSSSSSSEDDDEEEEEENDQDTEEEPEVAEKTVVFSSSSSSDSSSEEEEQAKKAAGLSKVAVVTLLKAIEQGGGLDNHTKENHKLSAICNGDKQLFGAPGTKKRRQVQNKLSYLKGLPTTAHYELLTDNGVVPSRETLEKYKSAVQTPAGKKKKPKKKTPSTPAVDKENLQQNQKQTPIQSLASPSSRASRANASIKRAHTSAPSSSVKILSPPKPMRINNSNNMSSEYEHWPADLVGHPHGALSCCSRNRLSLFDAFDA